MIRENWKVLAVAAVGIAAVAGAQAVFPEDEPDEREATSTPYEAACRMLEDGDSAVEAFDILVGLDVPELAASRAVNQATANGCG